MNVQQALEYIHSVSWKGSVPGLERISKLLSLLGNPEKSMKYVHIVGTNGKGSTAVMLSSILKDAGYTVGMYTSPFILTFNERMQVNGEMISDEMLSEITEYIKPYADSMTDRPTEFELITAIAFEYFKRCKCDIVVLEAGMGGEFDATNVIPSPEVAVFTNIGLDHTDFLGDTVEKIAATKSGILKKGCHCVIYPSGDSIVDIIGKKCDLLGVEYRVPDFTKIQPVSSSLEGQSFNYNGLINLNIRLLGAHQLCNAANVLETIDCLKARGFVVSTENIRSGLKNAFWQGRFEVLCTKPLFIVDGGHNPQCMEALASNIKEYLNNIPLIAVTGVLGDKDFGEMYDIVAPFIDEFYLVTPPSPRALKACELKKSISRYGKPIYVCDSVKDGVEKAMAAVPTNGAVLAFGSLYMICDIKNAVENLK